MVCLAPPLQASNHPHPPALCLLSILPTAGIVLEGLEEWEILPEEIVLGPRIGIGSFGEVYRGIWRQTDVAVKRLLDQEVSQHVSGSGRVFV